MVIQGFYYDAFYGDLGLNDDHFKKIESGASKAAAVIIIHQRFIVFIVALSLL